MKALKEMTNVEKGYLLANLFPNETKGIMEAIEKIHYKLVEDKEHIVIEWQSSNSFVSIDLWYSWAHDVYSRIARQRKQLEKPKRFADQLFDGYNAVFTIDCIVKYAKKERLNGQFYHMVMALFDAE
jgi:hypothetical protein